MIKKELYIDSTLGALLLFLFIGFANYSVPLFESIDRYFYDLGSHLSFSTGETGRSKVTLIEIDDQSLLKFGPWPWSYQTIATIVDKLHHYGVKIIGLNIPLLDQEYSKGLKDLKELHEKLKIYPLAKEEEKVLPWIIEDISRIEEEFDTNPILIKSIQDSGNVILPAYRKISQSPNSILNNEELFLNANLMVRSHLTPSSLKYITNVERLVLPFTGIMQQAAGVGLGDSLFGKWGNRSHPLFFRYRNSFLPSMPLRMFIAYLNQKPSQAIIEEDQIQIGNHFLPTYKGEILIKPFHSKKILRTYSIVDLFEEKINPDFLKDQIILIGLNTYGMRPLMYFHDGEINANQWMVGVIDDMINNELISRPTFFVYLEIFMLIVLAFSAVFFFSRWNSLQRLTAMVSIIILVIAISLVLSAYGHIWAKTSLWIGCVLMIYMSISIRQFFNFYQKQDETVETSRLLALSLQSQGHLDQAFEKFKKLPLDSETKNLIYKLGLEYEQKRMTDKALLAYEYISAQERFKDLAERIPKLKELEGSSTIGSHGSMAEANILRDAPLEERSKVARYKVLSVLGRGSMGLVYKALDPKINRILAIKTIRFSDEFEEEVVYEIKNRFFREAEIAGQLSHPSIVTIFDVGEDGDLTYMAMEFLEGNDLTKFISKGSLLPFRKVLDVITSVADALDYAHKTDVIHRDIKPANIMLLRNGGVKVTDFGIAKAISSSRTKTGVILGTPNYMSPEQIMGQKIDSRSDIFSLGVLFYQLLVGRTPFQGESLSNLLYQITQLKHPAMQTFNPKIPAICDKIIDRALAKNPADRFQNAAEIAKYIKLLATKIDQMKRVGTTKDKG
jgi:serine/threonine-protein kinase